jgi:hypothetical protein
MAEKMVVTFAEHLGESLKLRCTNSLGNST